MGVKYCSDSIEKCGLRKCKMRGCILNNPLTGDEIFSRVDVNNTSKNVNSEFRPMMDLNTVATKARRKKPLNILEKSYLNWLNTKD